MPPQHRPKVVTALIFLDARRSAPRALEAYVPPRALATASSTSRSSRTGYHLTGTQTGTFSFDPDDPALSTSTGRFTTWFGENGNTNSFNATSTFSARGRTEEGEKLRFNVTTHLTIVGSDVVVVFEKVNCG
jgi:hypothetical protein